MRKASWGDKKRPMLVPNPKGKLFDQIREVMRFHHYSLRTERTYCQWTRRYLAFHRGKDRSGPSKGWRHPRELGAAEVAGFLSHLAVAGNVAANTQNQALNALVFLYEHVLQMSLGDIGEYNPRTVQELLGHENVATPQIYTHVMQKPGIGTKSPLDNL